MLNTLELETSPFLPAPGIPGSSSMGSAFNIALIDTIDKLISFDCYIYTSITWDQQRIFTGVTP
jgi:hypothetical protein